jgi:hypothetical protein
MLVALALYASTAHAGIPPDWANVGRQFEFRPV